MLVMDMNKPAIDLAISGPNMIIAVIDVIILEPDMILPGQDNIIPAQTFTPVISPEKKSK